MGYPFDQAACVYEDKRRPVNLRQGGDSGHHPIQELMPRDRAELVGRHFHLKILIPPVPDIDDRALRRAARVNVRTADKKARDFFNRTLGGTQPDPHHRLTRQSA